MSHLHHVRIRDVLRGVRVREIRDAREIRDRDDEHADGHADKYL